MAKNPMAASTNTFRVFVSSTFSDFVQERNALQQHVFPRLQNFCQRKLARFQAIDLRWGVTEEAGQDQQTMNICLEELRRCQRTTPRPNFILLLGQRYGWNPLPPRVDAAELEDLLSVLSDQEQQRIRRFYRRDDNALPAEYSLQSREETFRDRKIWGDEERDLRNLLRKAIVRADWPTDDSRRLKYETSATAQEIQEGAFAIPDAQDHVMAFIREIRTADGRLLQESLPQAAALKDFVDLKQSTFELDIEAQKGIDELKRQLYEKLGPERIKTYSAQWEGKAVSTKHIPKLCIDVYRSLRRMIHSRLKQQSAIPPVQEERRRHDEFAEHRVRDFTGQIEPKSDIERYLLPGSQPTAPMVLYGESGSGKSALLAKVSADHKSRYSAHKLVRRFIGATAKSTDERSLLEGLCVELGELYGADNTNLPVELSKLVVVFRNRLALASAEHPLALFLDALDQIQNTGRSVLSCLPDTLPPYVRAVISTTTGPVLDKLKLQIPSAKLRELGPMQTEDANTVISKWLGSAHRQLVTGDQREAIRTAIGRCTLPLYLRLVFEEARRWRSYDHPEPTCADVEGLIERLFRRLTQQLHHEPLLVDRAISYLRCSRYGLAEDEILDLLAADGVYWKAFLASSRHALPVIEGREARCLPVVIWSRLYHDLEPYFSGRSAAGADLIVFLHARFNEVADRFFLGNTDTRIDRHGALAAYFQTQADPEHNESWKGKSARPFLQFPWHLLQAGRKKALKACLLEHKVFFALNDAAASDLFIYWQQLDGPAQVGAVYESAFPTWYRAMATKRDISLDAHQLSLFLSSFGARESAARLLLISLQNIEAFSGSDAPEVAQILRTTAALHREIGDPSTALRNLERAISIDQKWYDEYDPIIAKDLWSAALLLEIMQQYEQALHLLYRASLICERGDQAELHQKIVVTMGSVYMNSGQLDEASAAFDRALHELNLGAYGPSETLGFLYACKGQIFAARREFVDAERFYRASIEINSFLLGTDNLAVLRQMNNLGVTYLENRHLQEGLAELKKSVSIMDRISDDSNPEFGIAYSNLSAAFAGAGEYQQALKCSEKAVQILGLRRDEPRSLFEYGAALNHYALALLRSGRPQEAQTSWLSALRQLLRSTKAGRPTDSELPVLLKCVIDGLGACGRTLEEVANLIAEVFQREQMMDVHNALVREWAGKRDPKEITVRFLPRITGGLFIGGDDERLRDVRRDLQGQLAFHISRAETMGVVPANLCRKCQSLVSSVMDEIVFQCLQAHDRNESDRHFRYSEFANPVLFLFSIFSGEKEAVSEFFLSHSNEEGLGYTAFMAHWINNWPSLDLHMLFHVIVCRKQGRRTCHCCFLDNAKGGHAPRDFTALPVEILSSTERRLVERVI
jgi:tetratricopeptide (TPR) repeat protein